MDSFQFQRFTVAIWAAGLATLVAACGADHNVPTVETKALHASCPAAPLPAGSDLVVYGDALEGCFADLSWADHSLTETSVVHSGAHSIRLDLKDVGALWFHRDSIPGTFGAIEFWIHSSSPNQQVALVLDAGTRIISLKLLSDILGKPIAAGAWQKVRAEFTWPAAAKGGMDIFLVAVGLQSQSTIFIDDMRLAAPKAPGPCDGAAAGKSCSDGNACNGEEVCDDGEHCLPGNLPIIDDGNPCTTDACDPMLGATHEPAPAGTSCSDGNLCNGDESCDSSGQCMAGTPLAVEDGNQCTADDCDPARGVTHVPLPAGTACSDGNACYDLEACDGAGACQPGIPLFVDDGNPCTEDSCDPLAGAVHRPLSAGTSCSDGNACNGFESCDGAGSCVAGVQPIVDDGNPCTADSCDPVLGVVHGVLEPGSSCSDGNACNGLETCNGAGNCGAGTPPALDDGNPCTTDACDRLLGAVHAPVPSGTPCSDGNLCNGEEACNSTGVCVAGAPPAIDDGDTCTADSCEPGVGVVHLPIQGCAVLPPDPVSVAPKLDPTVATDIAASTEFLYAGDQPIQIGVAAGTIEKRRVVILRGSVEDRDGNPLSNVTVALLGHPELGHTSTRADGMYDLAANGGGLLTLTFEKPGFLTSQRAVQTPWRDYVWAPKVTMVPLDPNVTTVDLTSSNLQVARGSPVTDEDGTRQARVVVKPGTQAGMLVNGQSQPLTALNIRATEYTVGKAGPTSMPGVLPPSSGYTYAVELSADEAIAAGASSVTFSKPLAMYVDNFLGFPVGSAVPTGYYDRERGLWVASKNGRVIQVVGVADGKAAIDTDGDGTPDTSDALTKLGIDDQELVQIGAEFAAGKSLWRVEITHFTPWDCNWPYGPPKDAVPPPIPEETPVVDEPNEECGSIIGCEDQSLGEALSVAGTPFTLHYKSDRTPGRRDAYSLNIHLSGPSAPSGLASIRLQVTVAGRVYWAAYSPAPNLSHHVVWDGKDAYGRTVQGRAPATVTVHYDYVPQYYAVGSDLENSFARVEASGASVQVQRQASIATISRSWTWPLGAWDARALGLGGWSMDVHSVYGVAGRSLLLGDGRQRNAQPFESTIDTIVGAYSTSYKPGNVGDGRPAKLAQLYMAEGVAVSADGSLFIADTYNNLIRRVGPDGIINTIAGNGDYAGDFGRYIEEGAQATAVPLGHPSYIAVSADGSVFFTDAGRICRIRSDGTITTVAGTREFGYSGDGGPAVAATLRPTDLAFGSNGSLFVADTGNHRIRRIGPDGIINTVAGTGSADCSGDGGPATAASIGSPGGIAVGTDGSLFIADWNNDRVRRVGPDGIITTVAGGGLLDSLASGRRATEVFLWGPKRVAVSTDGSLFITNMENVIYHVGADGIISKFAGTGGYGFSGDGGPARNATLYHPAGLAVGVDGSLYVADSSNSRIRVIRKLVPDMRFGEFDIASENGSEIYRFSRSGRHLKTLDATTAAPRYLFGYDASGSLTSITDVGGNVTTIERTGATATAIVAPSGQRTTLSVNSDGWLTRLTDPVGRTWMMDYSTDGLLQHFTDPLGRTHAFEYDDGGRLIKDEDPAGGSTRLVRTEQTAGYTVTTSTALGRTHAYQVEGLATEGYRRTTTDSSGLKTVSVIGADGSEETTTPDGTSVLVKKGPDPRWGMEAPTVQSVVRKTPAGLASSTSTTRSATLSEPGNPWSMTRVADAVSVNGKNWRTSYDAATRIITSTSPMGRTSVVTLDEKGRAVKSEVPGLAPVTLSYDERGRPKTVAQGERQTSFSYDAQGYLSSITDPLLRVTALESDAVGRLLLQTGPDGSTTQFRYDASSNIAGLTPPGRPEYGFEYTPVDLQSSFTPPSVGTWDPATRYSYDKDKALTSVARPDGVSVTTSYDAAGRVSKIEHPQGSVTLGYSPTTGQLVSAQTPEESLAYTYDGSLLTGVTWSGAVAGKVEYAYDNNFRVVSTTVNGANAASRGYDDDGLLSGVGGLTMTRYPANGLLTGTSVGTGAGAVTDSYGYTPFGEVASYSAKVGGKALLDIQYTRDALGRISHKVETIDGATATYEYGYDAASRLSEVKKDGVVTANWTYDANGNRTSETKGSSPITATYDGQDRLLTYGITSYAHGNAGELQSRTKGMQTTTYAYDVFGNLISAQLPDGAHLSYVVDAQGRRVGKKRNGKLEQGFLWESELRIAAELDAAGNVVSRFVYGGKINVPELIIKRGATYRVVADQLGSPRLIVNTADGAVVQRVEYDEWGRIVSDSNPGFQPFGFAGGLYDRDTGLLRLGARDYDSATGRWTSIDPLRFRGGQPNLFVYAANDPINNVDPLGLSARSLAKCFGWGMLEGAAGALVVMALGAAAATVLPVAVVTGALIVAGGLGGGYLLADAFWNGASGNWNKVAYDAGLAIGGAVVGGVGGRTAARLYNGVESPPWSFRSDATQGYDPSLGSFGDWLGTGLNPGSAAVTAAGAGGGTNALIAGPCRGGC